eukprot:TRINITY_DN3793_c0_g2_i1.p1 TRINITY_DN3793_c0_g2~~TRINITY_DN3793_c0_g2_i1.p1  ORF type:complete len:523 (-),score=89.03 TRINITY_DN3793_c0_g2_i1:293-1861(-)
MGACASAMEEPQHINAEAFGASRPKSVEVVSDRDSRSGPSSHAVMKTKSGTGSSSSAADLASPDTTTANSPSIELSRRKSGSFAGKNGVSSPSPRSRGPSVSQSGTSTPLGNGTSPGRPQQGLAYHPSLVSQGSYPQSQLSHPSRSNPLLIARSFPSLPEEDNQRQQQGPSRSNGGPTPGGAAADGRFSATSSGPLPSSSYSSSPTPSRTPSTLPVLNPSKFADNLQIFTLDELAFATDNFSAQNLLGEGGFGQVHKGFCTTLEGLKVPIAVKKLMEDAAQGTKEWLMEIRCLSAVSNHPNLVLLFGYCDEGGSSSLVYEFVSRRSLDQHLFSKDATCAPALTWQRRVNIAIGAARGLVHLHAEDIIHRDFKAANILLTWDYEAKLADFGLARQMDDEKTHVSTAIMGTLGYLDPCYAQTGQLTKRSDVYAYGVVILELISGKKAMGMNEQGRPVTLVSWAKPFFDARKSEVGMIADRRLTDPFPLHVTERLTEVASMCLQFEARSRPDMSAVVDLLVPLLE